MTWVRYDLKLPKEVLDDLRKEAKNRHMKVAEVVRERLSLKTRVVVS